MEISTIVFLIIILLMAGFFMWSHSRKGDTTMNDQTLQLLLQQMNELNRVVDGKIGESTKIMQESMHFQASENIKAIRNVTERLTKLDETNRQVVSFTDQLKSLQDILKNPKQRGILGEYYLETTLKNVLPPNGYQMQYSFKDGSIVDAVVFVKDRIIPIDSKFSLENYNRIVDSRDDVERKRLESVFKQDIKNRIDETSKYILPAEGTMDFAFMFIPHEAIYYDLLVSEIGTVKVNTQDLIEYAFKKNVLIVSPTSFLAFLQTVLQGLRALQIEESAKEIRVNVEKLARHLQGYEEYHSRLGKTLATTVNHFNASQKEFKKIDKDLLRTAGATLEYEVDLISKPEELD